MHITLSATHIGLAAVASLVASLSLSERALAVLDLLLPDGAKQRFWQWLGALILAGLAVVHICRKVCGIAKLGGNNRRYRRSRSSHHATVHRTHHPT